MTGQEQAQGLGVRLELAAQYLRAGRYRDAADLVAASAALPAETPAQMIELAKRLLYFNESEAVANLVRARLQRPLWHPAAEADLAALASMMGEQTDSLVLLERAIARAGVTPDWLYNRSQMRMYAGRMDEAERDLRESLRLAPGNARAYWALSKLPGTRGAEDDVRQLRALAQRGPLPPAQEVFRCFALFNRLDRLDRPAEAWDALAEGCRAKRAQLKYDPAAALAHLEALRAAEWRLADDAPAADALPTPIFIVGMHRSGTTLLERILGQHAQVAEGGELYDFPAQLRRAANRHFAGASDRQVLTERAAIDFADVGRRYLEHVRWRANRRAFLVDKLPSNYLNLGYLRLALPQAKVLHMTRAPMDTCFSNLKELFSNACAYSYDPQEMADYYVGYRQLMAFWHRVAPGYVLDVSYEALTRDPEAEARRVLAFCGLPWQPDCLEIQSGAKAVNTASSAQVREPIHRRNVAAWRRYAEHLGPLQERLRAAGVDVTD